MTGAELDALEAKAEAANPAAALDLIADLRQARAERDWLAVEASQWISGYRHDIDGPCVSNATPDDLLRHAKEAICQKN